MGVLAALRSPHALPAALPATRAAHEPCQLPPSAPRTDACLRFDATGGTGPHRGRFRAVCRPPLTTAASPFPPARAAAVQPRGFLGIARRVTSQASRAAPEARDTQAATRQKACTRQPQKREAPKPRQGLSLHPPAPEARGTQAATRPRLAPASPLLARLLEAPPPRTPPFTFANGASRPPPPFHRCERRLTAPSTRSGAAKRQGARAAVNVAFREDGEPRRRGRRPCARGARCAGEIHRAQH
eukprot:3610709-Prymnesium_polylepis.2